MLDASLEVRSAVLYGSLIVMLVFMPVFLLEGLTGAFFRPLALAYVLAILASLAVALTMTPALVAAAAAEAPRLARSQSRQRPEGTLSPSARVVRRSSEVGVRDARRCCSC